MRKIRIRGFVQYAAAFAFANLLALQASAIDFNWNVPGPADWNVGTNWDPEGPPSGGSGNHAFVNNGGTAEISADIPDIQDIFVGAGAGTMGTLNQTGGATFQGTGSWMFVGQDGGTGVYNLSGGMANKARLFIGRNNNGNGTLNVSGTGAIVGEELNIGVDGAADMLPTGTASFSGNATVSATGLIQLSNGSMTVTDDASLSSGNEVWVGQGPGRSATLDMDSGTISADTWIAIGRDSSTGVVNLSGDAVMHKVNTGTENSSGSFIVIGGLGTGGGGTLNISENATVISDTGMLLNETDGQSAVVNQTGGSVTLHDYTPRDFQPTYGQSLNIDPFGFGQGEYHLSGGTLTAETVLVGTGLFEMTGGVFSATNFMGDLDQNGGTLSPGNSPGTTTILGNYSLNSGELAIEINGGTAGSGYDQLVVTGDVTLAGSLALTGNVNASQLSTGQALTIIDNQGGNPIGGTLFAGINEGDIVFANGLPFSFSYFGGTGNDVVLTSLVPEPTSVALSLLALVSLLGFRRRR